MGNSKKGWTTDELPQLGIRVSSSDMPTCSTSQMFRTVHTASPLQMAGKD